MNSVSPFSRATPPRLAPPSARDRAADGPEGDPTAARTVCLLGPSRIGVDIDAPVDARIEAIAGCQRARFSREQLIAAGVSEGAIKRRVRSGRLVAVHRGVYGLPQTEEIPFASEAAALLACGESAVLSHHSAVTLWGLRVGTARPVHVTIPMVRSGPAPEGVIVHRSRILIPRDIRLHEGLPITSAARAILDAAATLPDRDVEQMLGEGMFARRLLTLAEVAELLARAGRHPGRARVARVASGYIDDTRTDSPPEERLFSLIRAAGLPEPQTRVPILGYRLDFYWPDLRLAVEVDAYGTHGSRARFEADRRRDARLLTECGVVVLRFTRAAIEERPHETIALLARAIGRHEARYDPLRSRSW